VSDGLLIDAARMAEASRARVEIMLDHVPLSGEYARILGDDLAARIAAATGGDDYELLFAAPAAAAAEIQALAERLGLPFTAIGRIAAGSGLGLGYQGEPVALPARLGYQHGGPNASLESSGFGS